jgi:hypothetical protein
MGSMTIPSVTYPLDLTGVNVNNLVHNEVHQIAVKKVRAIATVYGPFYAASMQVVDNKTGRLLTSGRDFYTTELYVIPTNQSGQDVCSIVIVTDTTASDTLSLTYQVLGGKYSDSDQSLADLLNSIDFDSRSTNWPNPIIKPQDLPLSFRLFGQGTRYGFEYAVEALERIEQMLRQGDQVGRDALLTYLEAHIGHVTPDLVLRTQYALKSAIAKHLKATNPHPQYFLRADQIHYPAVRKPINVSPANGAVNVSQYATLTGNAYAGFYHVPQIAAQFQVAADAGMTNILIDQVINQAVVSWLPFDLLGQLTRYYWRVRYQTQEKVWSDWSDPTSFTTIAGAVAQPSLTGPANGASGVTITPTLTSSAFAVTSGADTHASTDWEIWTGPNGTGTRVFASLIDAVNKTSIPIQPDTLVAGTTYYPRVRHRGVNYTSSAWSNAVSFVTANAGINTPTITTPTNGAADQILTPTLTADAFSTSNATDTHQSSDWEVWTGVAGTGALVWNSYADTANKTTISIPTGYLAYGTTYHPRVRYRGATIGVSGWSVEVTFATKVAPPAAGTVLASRCQGFDKYNQIADGTGGSSWMLAETNSTYCNYSAPVIPAPQWTSSDGQTFADRLGVMNEYITVFAVTGSGTDTYARTEWEVYNSANTLIASGSSTTQSISPNVAANMLVNHAAYKMRARFVGANLGASPWSTYINFNTNWPDSPAAGTVLRTYCTGFDKYEERSDGNYGSTIVLAETNSGYCGYIAPSIPAPQWTSIDGQSLADRFGTMVETISSFTVVGTGTDTYARTEWEVYNSGSNALVASGSSTSQSISPNVAANALANHAAYKMRARFVGANLGASPWSTYINFSTNWADSPAAGTVLRTYCSGFDKYEERSDGNYGSVNVLVESNSSYCGYVSMFVAKPTITNPASGGTYGDWYAVNAINFNNTPFTMGGNNPTDVWGATEYQLLDASGNTVVHEFSVQAASYLSSTFANLVLDRNSGVVDNTTYLVHMRHRSAGGLVSPWSDPISIIANFTDAGTPMGTQCFGFDKYQMRADGHGGVLRAEPLEFNSTSCGYVPPANQAPLKPWDTMTVTAINTSGGLALASFTLDLNGNVHGDGSPAGNVINGRWLPQGANANDYEVFWTYGHDVHSAGTTNAFQWGAVDVWGYMNNDINDSNNINIVIRNKHDNSLAVTFTIVLQLQIGAPTFTSATLDGLVLNNTTTSATAQESLYLNTDGTWTTTHSGGTFYQSKPNGRWMDAGQSASNFEISVAVVQDTLDNGFVTFAGGDPGTGYYNMGSGWRMTLSDSSGSNSAGSGYEVKLSIRNKTTGEIYVADVTMHAQSGCFAVGTVLRTPSGDTKVEDLKAGDLVSSFAVPTMVDESEGNWLDWKTTSIDGFDPTTTAVVKGVAPFTADQSIKVNGIHSTLNHIYFIFDGVEYGWKRADAIVMTDMFIDDKRNLVPITSIELVNEPSTFVAVDVEVLDTLQVKSGDAYLMSHNATLAT